MIIPKGFRRLKSGLIERSDRPIKKKKEREALIPDGWYMLTIGQQILKGDQFWWDGNWQETRVPGDKVPAVFHSGEPAYYIRRMPTWMPFWHVESFHVRGKAPWYYCTRGGRPNESPFAATKSKRTAEEQCIRLNCGKV